MISYIAVLSKAVPFVEVLGPNRSHASVVSYKKRSKNSLVALLFLLLKSFDHQFLHSSREECPSPKVKRCPSPKVKRCPSPKVKRCPSPKVKRCPSLKVKRWPSLKVKRWPSLKVKRWPSLKVKRWPSLKVKRWPSLCNALLAMR